jgi:hypothetical protein
MVMADLIFLASGDGTTIVLDRTGDKSAATNKHTHILYDCFKPIRLLVNCNTGYQHILKNNIDRGILQIFLFDLRFAVFKNGAAFQRSKTARKN